MKRSPLLRRTELRTRTPLQRSKPMPRAREPRPSSVGTSRPVTGARKRPADTGPSTATRRLVLDRADGCCEICGVPLHDGTQWDAEHSFHHRRPRRMGGSSDPATNRPANLLLLCGSATTPGGCHTDVESQRALALAHGWLLHDGQNPAEVLVDLAGIPVGYRAQLHDDGGITLVTGDTRWRYR